MVYIRNSEATPAADLKQGSPDTKSNSFVRIQEEIVQHDGYSPEAAKSSALDRSQVDSSGKKPSPYFLQKNFLIKKEKSKILKPVPSKSDQKMAKTQPVSPMQVEHKANNSIEDFNLREQERLTRLLKAAFRGMPSISKISKNTNSSTEKSVTSFPSQTFLPLRRTITQLGRAGKKRGTYVLPSVKEETYVVRGPKRISSLTDFHDLVPHHETEIKPKGEAFRLQLFTKKSSHQEKERKKEAGATTPLASRPRLASVSELVVPHNTSSLSPRKSSIEVQDLPSPEGIITPSIVKKEMKESKKPLNGAFSYVLKKTKKVSQKELS